MKNLLVMLVLLHIQVFGVSLNTEVFIGFPQEKIMSINVDMCVSTIGYTNRETILDKQLKLKTRPTTSEVSKLKTAFENVVEVITFLSVIETAICSEEVEDLSVFGMSDLPIKVLLTRPLLPIHFEFIRMFNDTYIVKDEENDWLEAIDEMEEINKEWDKSIRNIYLRQ